MAGRQASAQARILLVCANLSVDVFGVAVVRGERLFAVLVGWSHRCSLSSSLDCPWPPSCPHIVWSGATATSDSHATGGPKYGWRHKESEISENRVSWLRRSAGRLRASRR